MKTSPLQRSLKLLRSQGYTVHIVEHFNPHVKIRQDFGGFADCLCYKADERYVLAVNAMHLRNRNDHAKFEANPHLKVWIASGQKFHLHQWHKVGPRGERKLWKVETVDWQSQRKQE